jgi:hypothetical protein
MDDFPILPEPGGITLLFADDIECHVHGKEAEAKYHPITTGSQSGAENGGSNFQARNPAL